MEGYWIWLIFLALAIFSVRIIQLQEGRSKRLQQDCSYLQEEISELGGETIRVALLHAKTYMVDRKEAIVTPANLTKGGTESNYEGEI